MAWLPYLLVALLLVCSRVFAGFESLLTSVTLDFTAVLGEADISASSSPLYLPGGLLVISALIAAALQTKKPSSALNSALFASTFGNAFPLISSTIGALGAFIAGSNTVSNMMFSQFQ